MAMISPTYEGYNESISTLKFATRAKKIKNEARINEDVDHRALLRKYEVELKKLRKQLAEKKNEMHNKEEFLRLEQDKKRAEEDKEAAITALEARSREFLLEKEEKTKLEEKIKQLASQLLIGGNVIEETPQFRTALEAKHKIIREEYEGKLQEIEKERQMIEADKAQVDRYKQLLLKQRDIMLALTARINERDDTIIQLQEEMDALERINKNHEYNLNQKTNKIFQLKKIMKEKGIIHDAIDTQSDDEDYSLMERKYLPYPVLGAIPPDVIFGEDEDQDIIMNLMTADEKVDELQNIINQKIENSENGYTEGKENLDEYGKIRQLESRLDEVVKENENLIDELQDRKFEVYKLKNKNETKEEAFESVETELEDKIGDALKKFGMSNKNISNVQKLI